MSDNLRGVSELPYILHQLGVDYAVVSPGSRNAPLILSLVNHGSIELLSICDERSAAYVGLGIAQQTRKPVALVCTSGTAFVNYGPAITEAYYMGLPLIVISADRPPEWIDQYDGQAIRQSGFFPKALKKSFDLPVSTEKKSDLTYFRRSVSEAVGYSVSGIPGPVHLNLPLREPLYNPQVLSDDIPAAIAVAAHHKNLSEESWDSLRQQFDPFDKKLIVCGFFHDKNPQLEELLSQMARSGSAVVIAENLSNLFNPEFIHHPESFIAALDEPTAGNFQPDLLITIGNSIVSKRLKKYLRSHPPKDHWHVDEYGHFKDTFSALSLNIPVQPLHFFERMIETGSNCVEYNQMVSDLTEKIASKHSVFLRGAPFSDLKVFERILEEIPANSRLHLANSTAVRYSQLFAGRGDLFYFSNRGTSGIDGCVSTAAGAAIATDELNVLLVGDIAFIYDSNGLWNVNLPKNLRIILIDNGGGNIFRLIETGPELEKILPFIETPHRVDLGKLCRAFGVEYMEAGDLQTFSELLPLLFKPESGAAVLHVRTDGNVSARIFQDYFKNLRIRYE